MYRENASTDVAMDIRFRYIPDVQKYWGNVEEEENNYKVVYQKKKIIISMENNNCYF